MRSNLFGEPTDNRGAILGCSQCPLDRAPGINKVKGLVRIKNQKAFLWAMCPGEQENAQRLELVGRAGKLLWDTLKPLGLSRSDFATQNIVRCRPTDEQGQNRDPSKRELACCAPYNDEALRLNAGNARVHVVLGDVAATQLLGKGYKKDKPVAWNPELDAYVVLNHHPSYILRQGKYEAGWDYFTWRDRFQAVRACMEHPGRWGFVKSQGYKTVRTLAEFDTMERALRQEQEQNRRVSFDIEDGRVDGKPVLLIAGFGTGHYEVPKHYQTWKGQCYSVVLEHPQSGYAPAHLKEMQARVKRLVEDGDLKKSLQNGSYENTKCRELLDSRLRGYDFDTMYGTFIRYSFLRSCSLENLTYRFFPEFADYKETTDGWDNFADVPIDRLVLRNSGDCEITKRLEERFGPQISYPLVKIYLHCGMTLDRMEGRGPLLDWPNWKAAKKIVPEMIKQLDRQLQHISGEPDFDCDSPQQVAHLIYDILQLPMIEGSRSTQKNVLEQIAAENEEGAKVIELISKRRALGRMDSTYLEGYARSAQMHEGELHTRWFLTGAVSGRLRSGGDGEIGFVNFMNFHSNPLLSNLLVSDLNWRKAMND